MNIANSLTTLRLVLSPVFVALFVWDNVYARIGALAVACLFELTDVLDGYFARKYKQVSDFGKLLDPFADSVSRFSVFLSFLVTGHARIWMIVIIFYRDALVSWIRANAASKNVIISARASGKIKAMVQGPVIIAIVFMTVMNHASPNPQLFRVSSWLMIGATVITALSGVDYAIAGIKTMRKTR
jgi:CDP-diacylglycerol--glycerol-3-phosphate 3-phosphatidyltransferase